MQEGIIYSLLDYKEKSIIVYLYTKKGLDSVLVSQAKNIKKGKMAFCEILNRVNYVKTKGKLGTLIDFEVLDYNRELKQDLITLNYAYLLLDVTRQISDLRHEKIYNYLVKTLEELKFNPLKRQIAFIYLVKMLSVFGINNIKEVKDLNYQKTLLEAYNLKDYNLTNFLDKYLDYLIDYYDQMGVIYLNNIKKLKGVYHGRN